jgi:hypothetical protein
VKNPVLDSEILYRCIFYGRNWYKHEQGRLLISSQAFSDRNFQPSVDRASLRRNNPCLTQCDSKDGVVSLLTCEVRLIDVSQNNEKGNPIHPYKIDVVPRPMDTNDSHAQIEASPEYKNKAPFRKVQERLAYLANQRSWEIFPHDFR